MAMVLVVTGNSLLLLDPKSLAMKYRVELQHIKQISLSCFSDQIFVVHLDPVSEGRVGGTRDMMGAARGVIMAWIVWCKPGF